MKRKAFTWSLFGALTAICLGFSEARATVTPYVVDTSDFSDYTIIADGGNTNINNSTITGDVGIVGGSLGSSNNSTITGDVGYKSNSFSVNYNGHMTITGDVSKDVTLSNASAKAAIFSKTIASFTPTQILSGDLSNPTLTSTGDLNVIDLTGNNINGTITLVGDSDDVFYINVSGNLNINSIVLDGVDAKNVYWNLISGNSGSNLTGTLYGTFLSYNTNSSQAVSLNINNATIEGNIYGGSLNLSNVTINGVALSDALQAPEASSMAALGLFAALILGSGLKHLWNRRRSARQIITAQAA